MRKTCFNTIYELAKLDPRVVFVGSDLGAGVLDDFKRDFPDRFFMEGVSEQYLVGVSAGMAREGNIVYVATVAAFITRRCFEQIVLDVGLHHANVKLISIGGGLVYTPLGPTHLALDDIALMRSVPGMTVTAPADSVEMKQLMYASLKHSGPMYIRLAKGGEQIVTADTKFIIGRAKLIKSGTDALVVTTGITLQIALEAREILFKKGLQVSIMHMPTVKPLDKQLLSKTVVKIPVIVTIEEHFLAGGLGSAISEFLSQKNLLSGRQFRIMAIADEFPGGYGSQSQQLAKFGLTASKLVKVIYGLCSK
ncbi:transketolase [Candidatus Gottesmanbacteria bacterium RBG_16_43_7]|uniref:Transketolase n=1 Tax=Candidatus Gottesmanbacteria bacterium RBG_16_43_7 TaxID=1798373 RepID=A0A1F5ZAW8_9BACT|nr:MAG: transketolase [Candidatus Gottesmanbacteria bacterium RBG_16_43_7]